MKPTYKNFIKDHWLSVLILTFAHAFIIPAFIMIKTSPKLWDDIFDDGKQFVKTKIVEGIYLYDEDENRFIPMKRKTNNPYNEYLTLTLILGSLGVWLLSTLIYIHFIL